MEYNRKGTGFSPQYSADGPPAQVLNKENIRHVYKVDVNIPPKNIIVPV